LGRHAALEDLDLSARAELAESWAFGDDEAPPAFTLWGQEDVAGDLLLDAILSAEPDDTLSGGDPS
jgi:hypothetical protein